jgi:four helix bundle protein
MIKSYKDLDVYKMAYKLALEIFQLTRKFPQEELYSLTSQINRSSRSISANIAEGWAKREYETIFKQHLIIAVGSCSETENWFSFSKDFNYTPIETFKDLSEKLDVIGKKITRLHQNWKNYDNK